MITFQEMLKRLQNFWESQGCIIQHGYDLEVGAGTFNPATFLRCLGPEPYRAFYIEPCRRPTDGRYGTNPNRLQHYFQCQVILKPSPQNIQDLCLQSLEAIGFDLSKHDMRFVHDDWESPTLGAWGLGWEVWMDGMEVTQFTYFQAAAGINLKPVTGEVTYGLERLATHLQNVSSIFDIQWTDGLTYGDLFHRNEIEWSHYNFTKSTAEMWFQHFNDYEKEAKRALNENLPIPAYDFVIKASHAFNMLDARGVISVTERTGYITRIRDLACEVAKSYLKSRESLGYPLLQKLSIPSPKIQEAPSPIPQELINNLTGTDDFLLEIGSEEIPASFVQLGCSQLRKAMEDLLKGEGIAYKNITTYGTPRRLAIYIQGMAKGVPSQNIEKKGPSVEQAYDTDGKIKPAGEGFFKSIQMSPPDLSEIRNGNVQAVELRAVKNTEYLYATIQIPEKATARVLQDKLPSLILNLDFPKKMRWGDLDIVYPRPIRWIVSLFGVHVVPFNLGYVAAGKVSQGHRQLHNSPISLKHAQDYVEALRKHFVMVDPNERKHAICKQLDDLEKQLGASIVSREQVLPQVLHLVEWPFATTAEFDPAFLKAPKEVLISEMVEHQKYFPVLNLDGTLKNSFIITANTTPTDTIRAGNQQALSPRLNDGVFLYEQGLKTPLEKYNDKLKNMTFQKNLGSVYDKVLRISKLANTLHGFLKMGDLNRIKRAAELCKADLATEMVFEFPDLQGIIGRYYALAQGEDPEVARAIEEHWMPRGENAPLPETDTGVIISLADKIDNLIGCYAAGLIPTSSSDPYALRRQVLGMIKIIIKEKFHLPLNQVLKECLSTYPGLDSSKQVQLLQEIEAFISNRVKTVFQDYNISKDEIEAGLSYGFHDIYDAYCRVNALHRFRTSNKKFSLLYEVYKRAKGQIMDHQDLKFSPQLLQEDAEINLDRVLESSKVRLADVIKNRDYDKAYELMAEMQPSLAKLFDEVKILADDQRLQNNRIALLQRVFGMFAELLDFSKIQVAKTA